MISERTTTKKALPTDSNLSNGIIRRKCACGVHTAGGMCAECKKKKLNKKLQTKLIIGESNDSFEQEADLVAKQVMQMPKSRTNKINGSCEYRHNPLIQRRFSNVNGGESSGAPPIVHDVLRSSGHPLDQSTRNFMEPRFGYDFSQVRLHTDNKAAQSARAINALAYTVGHNIVLGTDHSMQKGLSRQQVFAHELTHVIQQNGALSKGVNTAIPHNATTNNTEYQTVSSELPVTVKRIERRLQRLGANPGCTTGQARDIHQSIFNANSWVRKALTALAARPLTARTLRALRNNFGASGTAANAPAIATNLRSGQSDMISIPYSCADATDATCAAAPCGYTTAAGAHASVICTNATLATNDAVYRGGCVLHEAMHASDASMAVDSYSGWFGHSGSTAGYPGASPMVNADSYTTLAMELS